MAAKTLLALPQILSAQYTPLRIESIPPETLDDPLLNYGTKLELLRIFWRAPNVGATVGATAAEYGRKR